MTARQCTGILWVSRDNSAPHPYLVEACRRAGAEVRELHWAVEFDGERPVGRFVELGRRAGRTHPMSFKLVSLRLLAKFARASEGVTIVYELGLVGMYAASPSPYGGAGSSRWWRAITGTSGGPAQRSPRSPSGA